MLRALVVSLGLAVALSWLVGLVNGSTGWLVWSVGAVALLAFGAAAALSPTKSGLAASAPPALLGSVLGVLFLAGIATHASGWLVWFTLFFGGGFLAVAGLTFFVHVFEPRSFSRTPMTEQ